MCALGSRMGSSAHKSQQVKARLTHVDAGEVSFAKQSRQILYATLHAAMECKRREHPAKVPDRTLDVHNEEPSPGLQDASNLGETLAFQVVGQVVHHQAAEHDIKGGIRECQRLNYSHL